MKIQPFSIGSISRATKPWLKMQNSSRRSSVSIPTSLIGTPNLQPTSRLSLKCRCMQDIRMIGNIKDPQPKSGVFYILEDTGLQGADVLIEVDDSDDY